MEIQPSSRVISIRVPWWLHLWFIDTRRVSQLKMLAYALYKLNRPLDNDSKRTKAYSERRALSSAIDQLLYYAQAETPSNSDTLVMKK